MTRFAKSYDEAISTPDSDRWERIRRHRPTYERALHDAKPYCAMCGVPLTGLSWASEECSGFHRKAEVKT